jgi:hypothetical protein
MNSVLVVLHLLDVLVAVTGAIPQVQALQAKLQLFKAEGRDPTAEEWNELFDSIEGDGDRLNEADERLNNGGN